MNLKTSKIVRHINQIHPRHHSKAKAIGAGRNTLVLPNVKLSEDIIAVGIPRAFRHPEDGSVS
jgi:hypothetical protein